MSNLNKILLVLGLVTVIGLLYKANSSSDVDDVNVQQQQRKAIFHQEQIDEEDISLNNTKSTLNTLLAEKKQSEAKIESLKNDTEFLKDKIESMERSSQSQEGIDSGEYIKLSEKYSELLHEIEQLKEEQEKLRSTPSAIDNSFMGIDDSDLKPIGVTDYQSTPENIDQNVNSDSTILDMLVQPALDATGLNSKNDNIQPINSQNPLSITSPEEHYVWVEQSDRTIILNKDGKEEYVYPSSQNMPSELANITGDSSLPEVNQFGNTLEDTKKEVPIYTVPQNSTFFGSVGMSAILGRVPIGNELSNPFRFKIIIGSENLASNNFFMPHVESMTASGYAEGDFTLECARGTIDKVTFTFKDQTVREIVGGEGKDSLGWISDAYGVPCVSGQYFTTFPEFMAKQGALTTLSAFAGSIAQSAVTTTTNADGATTSIVNDATKKAAGEGFESGANELTRWYAERQASAFDVVYVPTGEPIVVNIEKALHIDYELDGRKLIHKKNGREYLGW